MRVSGGKLLDKNNQPVQLQGVSAHGLQWFPLVGNQTIAYSAEFLGAEAVRLAMYIEDYAPTDSSDYWGGYTADRTAMMQRVDQAINDAVNAGIYVLVDWHIHNIPGKYTAESTQFFSDIAKRYGHLPNIIYEICNEPVSVNWSTGIKPYANTVISAIRAIDPDGVVIVGTPNWSQDVDAAAQDPLAFSNVMYALHFYAATHDINTMKNKVQTALNAGAAIFVSEWGSSDVGTSRSDMLVAQQWMDFMNQKGLSWINWSLGNKDEASSILAPTAPLSGPWVDADLTGPGRWLKTYFDKPVASSATTSNSSSSSSSSSGSAATKTVVLTTTPTVNGITLNWAANNINVAQFEVYRDSDSELSGRTRLATVGTTQLNYTDASAIAGTTYYYSIKVTDVNNIIFNSIAVAGVFGGASVPSLPTSGTFKISNKLSSRALDVKAKSTADGASIQQYDYNGGENQKWRVNLVSADKYSIIASNSSKCLDVPNGTINNDVVIQQYTCSNQNNQIWVLVPANGYYQIKNVASGKCLALQNSSTANGALVVQSDCSITDSKLWKLDSV